jgi:hypothetical protein
VLEDYSIHVTMTVVSYCGKLSSSGVLFLTNYRLLFASRLRLVDPKAVKSVCHLRDSDFTTQVRANRHRRIAIFSFISLFNRIQFQIPLGSIMDIALSTESDITGSSVEAITLKLSDGRTLTFCFEEELAQPIPNDEMNVRNRAASESSILGHTAKFILAIPMRCNRNS